MLMKSVKNNQKKVKDGEMKWKPSLTLLKLEYVPLYGRSG
jgi:hypothetical protein